MGFDGKKNKQLPSESKGHALKNALGNASPNGSKKTMFRKPSEAAVSQKRVLRTASPADILGVQPKPSVLEKEASVPKKWESFYRKLLRLQTLLTDGNVTPEEGDEELLEWPVNFMLVIW